MTNFAKSGQYSPDLTIWALPVARVPKIGNSTGHSLKYGFSNKGFSNKGFSLKSAGGRFSGNPGFLNKGFLNKGFLNKGFAEIRRAGNRRIFK